MENIYFQKYLKMGFAYRRYAKQKEGSIKEVLKMIQ